ncbi:MAG: holo-ACP synthase [Eubacteriales bacterium]|jgi:holo-[acyl-carrier protein] synthase
MNIYGIGVDVIEVERIRELCQRSGFEERFFTPGEQAYFSEFKHPYEHIAGFFCAKEAFSKAIGTGIRDFSLQEVEVIHDSMGRPSLRFTGRLQQRMQQQKLRFFLSISHCSQCAIAQVTAVTAHTGGSL